MPDSVSGIPVFVLADLAVVDVGANAVGEVVDEDSITISTAGTNASKVSLTGLLATTVVTSGSGTGIAVLVDVNAAGAVIRATITGVGLADTDTVTISAIDGDAMDTNCILTVDDIQVVRDRWNARAVIAVSDHPADGGDGNERSIFVQKSKNNIWVLGAAKQGGQTGDDEGPQVVIPQ